MNKSKKKAHYTKFRKITTEDNKFRNPEERIPRKCMGAHSGNSKLKNSLAQTQRKNHNDADIAHQELVNPGGVVWDYWLRRKRNKEETLQVREPHTESRARIHKFVR